MQPKRLKLLLIELIDCFKNKNNFKEEEYKPNLDLLTAYIKNKTSKFVFDKQLGNFN